MGKRGIGIAAGMAAAMVLSLMAAPWRGETVSPPPATEPTAPAVAVPLSEPAPADVPPARTLAAAREPDTESRLVPTNVVRAQIAARFVAGGAATTLEGNDLPWRIATLAEEFALLEPALQVRLFADDRAVGGVSLRAPFEVLVPASTERLRFELRGFRPVLREAPTATDGALDCGTVVFEPDAALLVTVRNLPRDLAAEVTFWAGDSNAMRKLVQGTARAAAGTASLRLTAPSQLRLAVGVAIGDVGFYLRMAEPAVELAAGEDRAVVFDAAQAPTCSVALVGPSRELLVHLELCLDDPGMPRAAHDRAVALDRDGRAELRGFPSGEVQFELPGAVFGNKLPLQRRGDGALAFALAAGAAFELEPSEPIVGLRCIENGGPVPSRIVRDELALRRAASRSVHIAAARELDGARELVVAPDGAAPFRWSPQDRDRVRDLVDVAAGSSRLASLLVRCAYEGNRQLQLVPKAKADRGEVFDTTWMQVKEGRVAWDAVEPGDYVLRWSGSTLRTSAVADLHLAPGQRCEFELQPPADLVAWRVWLANAADVPDWVGMLFIRCNEVPTVCQRHGQDSIVALPADLAAPPVVAFSNSHRLPYVPGRVVEFDPGKHTLVVAFDFAAHAIVPVVQPMFGDAGAASLGTEISGSPRQLDGKGLFLPEGRTLPMCLYEKDDRGAQQLTAWCTVGAGMPAVRGAGRFVDFAIVRPFARGSVSVEGPEGHPTVRILERIAATGRVFVAERTRAVHVDLVPGGRFSFAADVPSIAVR